ncbi:hypothetical protein Rsub_02856 [Raphidocelis subcapitata]|uniref:Uncharacterized protein n=1 Tax=Raphidocelis subcapitata TaxID=307507 RepID=A0A2V0NPY1_9CHLO|nr:hypothetical protein Rsub_02856 [Raphidocelis subcapitata]|eukprot:GBF89686.1 hypothetical protein Rsub_02856 [Raphidocelis subcapitata]
MQAGLKQVRNKLDVPSVVPAFAPAAVRQRQRHRSRHRRPPRCARAAAAGDEDSGAPGPSSSGGGGPEAPWALMGRVVREEQLGLWQGAREALVARAVAQRCGLSDAELAARLQPLSNLLPTLADRLLLLRADLLAELAGDVAAVAHKMLLLKAWFPTADVGAMVGRRPSLLTSEEFDRIPSARRQLLARYPDPSGGGSSSTGGGGGSGSASSSGGDDGSGGGGSGSGSGSGDDALGTSAAVDALVCQQPLLLCEDLEALLAELQRLLPGTGTDAAAALARHPGLADRLVSNRGLSLW